MPNISVRLTDLAPKIKDALGVESDNQLYSLFWAAAFRANRSWKVSVSPNGQRATILNVAMEDLPTLARMAEIDAATAGEYTVTGLDVMIGVTNARWAQNSPINKEGGTPYKWNEFIDGVRYTSTQFENAGVTRNWFSSAAIDPNGLTIAQYVAINGATGVQVRTHASYQSIAPQPAPIA